MITPKRLKALTFQAQNKGFVPAKVEDMKKRGIKVENLSHGAMIVVSPIEMMVLLEAYAKVASE